MFIEKIKDFAYPILMFVVVMAFFTFLTYCEQKITNDELTSHCALVGAKPLGRDNDMYFCASKKDGHTIRIEMNGSRSKVVE